MSKTIVKLKKNQTASPQLIGGKGANLLTLFQNNFNVPKAFFITTNAFTFFAKENQLVDLLNQLSLKKTKTKQNRDAKAISEKIQKGKIPPFLAKKIEKQFNNLKTKTVSVRSSINIEDGPKHSFAGQFESFLNIKMEGLHKAIKDCWAAAFSSRAILYTTQNNISLACLKPAIVIQKMIHPDKGGVTFTKNPSPEHKNQLLIETCRGSTENIVNGLANPERYLIDKYTLNITKKNSHFSNNVLNRKEAKKLAQIALKIELLFGLPQDIEWAIKNKKIYILQARPLTHSQEIPRSFFKLNHVAK